jgi:phosphoglycolate phosphatase
MQDTELAIIFDLDGTLWDSTGCACDIWNRVLEKHNEISFRMTKEKASQLMGKTMEDIGKILFPMFDEAKRNAVVNEFGTEEVKYLTENGAVLYDGLEEVLAKLHGNYKLYIVSNCQDGYVSAFLHAHKLERYFQDIEMSGRTGQDKGSNIKMIMERNNIKFAVYIGDTEGDEKAARFAGIPFIYAEYGFGNAVSPDAVITRIKQLPKCIKEKFI